MQEKGGCGHGGKCDGPLLAFPFGEELRVVGPQFFIDQERRREVSA